MADGERLHALNRELLESPGLDLVRDLDPALSRIPSSSAQCKQFCVFSL